MENVQRSSLLLTCIDCVTHAPCLFYLLHVSALSITSLHNALHWTRWCRMYCTVRIHILQYAPFLSTDSKIYRFHLCYAICTVLIIAPLSISCHVHCSYLLPQLYFRVMSSHRDSCYWWICARYVLTGVICSTVSAHDSCNALPSPHLLLTPLTIISTYLLLCFFMIFSKLVFYQSNSRIFTVSHCAQWLMTF